MRGRGFSRGLLLEDAGIVGLITETRRLRAVLEDSCGLRLRLNRRGLLARPQ